MTKQQSKLFFLPFWRIGVGWLRHRTWTSSYFTLSSHLNKTKARLCNYQSGTSWVLDRERGTVTSEDPKSHYTTTSICQEKHLYWQLDHVALLCHQAPINSSQTPSGLSASPCPRFSDSVILLLCIPLDVSHVTSPSSLLTHSSLTTSSLPLDASASPHFHQLHFIFTNDTCCFSE